MARRLGSLFVLLFLFGLVLKAPARADVDPDDRGEGGRDLEERADDEDAGAASDEEAALQGEAESETGLRPPELLEYVEAELPEGALRSEEHTSELQSRPHLVCRLLLEKK